MQQPTAVAISTNTSGDNAIVAAASGKTTRLVGLVLVAAGTVTVTIKDGMGGTAKSGAMTLTAGEALVLPILPPGGGAYVTTSVNSALNFALGGAVQVSGIAYYTQS